MKSSVKLRLNTGELVVIGRHMTPAVMDRYFALLDIAGTAAQPRQTIPPNMLVVWEVGEELGLWTIIENTHTPFVKGRIY